MIRAGRVVAATLVVALATTLAWAGLPAPSEDTRLQPTTSVVPSVATPVTTPPLTVPPTSRPVPVTTVVEPDVLTVVAEGLAAWGRFAVSGDLALVDPWFDRDGPQHRQFRAEASALAADPLGAPPYAVVMEDPRVDRRAGETEVAGRVVFARTGEPSQSFRWRVVVHPVAGRPMIWTVEDLDYRLSNGSGAGGSGTAVPQN